MRIRITLFLSAFLLLSLTGCSQLLSDTLKETEGPTAPVYTQGDETQPTGADTPSDAPTGPAKSEMLGYDENGFSLWPEGNYLADPKFDTDEYLPDFDVDNALTGIHEGATVCSTPETIYVASYNLKGHDYLSHVAFADKATGIVAPLCGRPECTHKDENCNAYVGAHAYGMRLYDGKLWWVSTAPASSIPDLRCMEPDGTNHELVARLEERVQTMEFEIHRGYVYAGQIGWKVLDGKPAFSFNVVAYSMDDGSMITILDQIHEGGVNAGSRNITILPVGNDIYILLRWTDEREDGGFDLSTRIYRWSSKTRQAEQLYSAEDDQWNYSTTYSKAYPVREEGLYFVTNTVTKDPNAPLSICGEYTYDGRVADFTLMRLSFKTGELEEVSSFSVFNADNARIARDYIAVIGTNQDGLARLMVYDYGGNLLSVSEPVIDYTLTMSMEIGGDEDYYYIQYGLAPSLGFKPGVLAVPVRGGALLDINNSWRPQL